jgi:GTP cyclohydrolase IA
MARSFDPDKIIAGVKLILEGIGEDPKREGVLSTPERVADFWKELTEGYDSVAEEVVTLLPGESHRELVIVRNIEFSSVCEHHLAPFFGVCDIAYLPGKAGIIGLSKLGRLVDLFARRLQVQERLTTEIADSLYLLAKAEGVVVRMVATHTCMTMRGVRKTDSETITQAKRGVYETDDSKLAEVLSLI